MYKAIIFLSSRDCHYQIIGCDDLKIKWLSKLKRIPGNSFKIIFFMDLRWKKKNLKTAANCYQDLTAFDATGVMDT